MMVGPQRMLNGLLPGLCVVLAVATHHHAELHRAVQSPTPDLLATVNRHPGRAAVVAFTSVILLLLCPHYCRPRPPFPQPFKLTKTAGFLMLLFFEITWSLFLFVLLRLARCFATWELSLVMAFLATPVVYGIMTLYAWRRWNTYFAPLRYRNEDGNATDSRLPREQDMGVCECKLSMRPTKIEWYSFVWCMFFIYPFFMCYAGWLLSTTWVVTRITYRLGIHKKDDAGEALADFLLSTTIGLAWFQEVVMLKDESGNETLVGVFNSSFAGPLKFPAYGGSLLDKQLLEVKVDLVRCSAFEAALDGQPLPVELALYLAVYQTVWFGHAWVHSLAMWGIDEFSPDPWVARMSVCSLFFNHLGGDGGAELWNQMSGAGIDPMILADVVAVQRPLRDFARWRPLMPYSRFIRFIEGTREIWFRLLKESEFANAFGPLMDPEGHYIATILHSIDHWMLYNCFGNTHRLVLFCYDGPECGFGNIDFYRTGKLVCTALCLADDWPKLFDVYMRQSPHPFYQRVYQEAVAIDAELAWHMQNCMIK